MAEPTLPPLDIVGPDGDRITVRALDRHDTVGRLADRLHVGQLWMSGRALGTLERLSDIDELRIGARLSAGPGRSSAGGAPSHTAGGEGGNVARREVAAPEVAAPEVAAPEVAAPEVAVPEVAVPEVASPEVAAPEVAAPEVAVLEVAVVAGPSTSNWQPLGPGRHLVGRAGHARVRVDEPAVEPNHALLIVSADGSIEIVQLSGPVPIRIGGRAHEASTGVGLEDRVTIGSSTLRFRRPPVASGGVFTSQDSSSRQPFAAGGVEPAGTIAAHSTDPWRRVVWRAPHRPPTWTARPVVAPVAMSEPARPAPTSLVGVAVTAVGALVIAQVLGNVMFILLAAMGAVASLTTFVVGTVNARRKRSKMRVEHAAQADAFRSGVDRLHGERRAYHDATNRSILETFDAADGAGSRVWQRRFARDSDEALRAVVGTGTHRWRPEIEVPDPSALDPSVLQHVEASTRLVGVDAPISIRPGEAIALHGAASTARSVARSIVTQLATWVGPADWQLVVVSSEARRWRWVDWLPHGAFGGSALIVLDGADTGGLAEALDAVEAERTTVLVTDEPQLLVSRTGALRRFLGSSGAASIVVVDTDGTVPAPCRRVLTVGSTGSASWSGDIPDEDDTVAIEFVGVSVDTADEIARNLACLVDPESSGLAGAGLAGAVSFGELLPAAQTTPDTIARRWRESGSDPAPAAPLGSSVDGRIDIDLVRDGPHGLIAGTTGSGKSELLRTLVLSLAASVGPQHLNFVLVDYKGGSTFDACAALPHTVGLVTDLDAGLAQRALVSLDAELHRRERMLRRVAASDLTDYRSRRDDDGAPLAPIARLAVVIDEFAALAKELPDFLNALVGIAQRGRSLGVHLLLATQRPAGVVNDDIRANTNLRLALRLHDRADALDVVGDELPAKFPRGLPGRAALRLGPDELVVFQAARCTGPHSSSDPTGMVVEHSARHRRSGGQVVDGSGPAVGPSELEVVAATIVEAATVDGVTAPHRPWIEPLPFPLRLDACLSGTGAGTAEPTVIGVIDDPERQRRVPLAWQPDDGNLALIGSIGSGTTGTMISLAAGICGSLPPDRLHLYVIDARGDDGLTALSALAHCGGVVRITEDERMHRLLAKAVGVIDDRMTSRGDEGPHIVVMIDGYGSVRAALGSIERQATFDLLQRLVNDGPPVRVHVVIADDATNASTIAPVANRWVFHLDDPSIARSLGLRGAPAPPDKPGRLRVLACGREAQVALGAAGLAALPARGEVRGGPEPIRVLPDAVAARSLADHPLDERRGFVVLPVGLSSADLGVATLDVAAGDHVLVVGSPRSGVTTAVERCAASWEADARGRGEPFEVVRIGRRTPVAVDAVEDPAIRVCVVADDAHRIDDHGILASFARGEHPHVTVIAGGRADAVRGAYGHWTREIAKARCGIVLTSRSDPDGDLLGAPVPRRSPIPARPGLAWLVDAGPLRLVQIATD